MKSAVAARSKDHAIIHHAYGSWINMPRLHVLTDSDFASVRVLPLVLPADTLATLMNMSTR